MSDNLNRLTKAELIEMLEQNLAKKDLDISNVRYDPAVDFPEREKHWAAKKEKQRIFNATRGKGAKELVRK